MGAGDGGPSKRIHVAGSADRPLPAILHAMRALVFAIGVIACSPASPVTDADGSEAGVGCLFCSDATDDAPVVVQVKSRSDQVCAVRRRSEAPGRLPCPVEDEPGLIRLPVCLRPRCAIGGSRARKRSRCLSSPDGTYFVLKRSS